MSRNLTTIYTEAVEYRNKYLELTEVTNDSKMSVINAFTWVVSALIYSFENILDVFTVDIAEVLNNRINGTPAYYVNSLLKYQKGDTLTVNAEGTGFSYDSVDTNKRTVTKVSYEEAYSSEYKDTVLLLKAATGTTDALEQIDAAELVNLNAYVNQIKFAGTKVKVVSRKGDILVPKVTVYYDGAVSIDDVYTNIENALIAYIGNLPFDSTVYASQVVDAIQSAEHVSDVYINPSASSDQGIYIAKYDDNNVLGTMTKIDRTTKTNSGYLKESSKEDSEADMPTWREAITLLLEEK